jgi:hypothetical protein
MPARLKKCRKTRDFSSSAYTHENFLPQHSAPEALGPLRPQLKLLLTVETARGCPVRRAPSHHAAPPRLHMGNILILSSNYCKHKHFLGNIR